MPPFLVRPDVDCVNGITENKGKDGHDSARPHSGQAAQAHEKDVIAVGEVEEHLHRNGRQGLVLFFLRAGGGSSGGGFLMLALLKESGNEKHGEFVSYESRRITKGKSTLASLLRDLPRPRTGARSPNGPCRLQSGPSPRVRRHCDASVAIWREERIRGNVSKGQQEQP